MCQEIHQTVITYSERFLMELSRYNYVTPTSYLELLGLFSSLMNTKKSELNGAQRRLEIGLDKVLICYCLLGILFWKFVLMKQG